MRGKQDGFCVSWKVQPIQVAGTELKFLSMNPIQIIRKQSLFQFLWKSQEMLDKPAGVLQKTWNWVLSSFPYYWARERENMVAAASSALFCGPGSCINNGLERHASYSDWARWRLPGGKEKGFGRSCIQTAYIL